MLILRAMACFAVHVSMLTLRLRIRRVRVTCLTCVVAGVLDWMSGNLSYRCPAIMSVLAKASGDNKVPHHQKNQKREDKETRKPEEMSCIFKSAHRAPFP